MKTAKQILQKILGKSNIKKLQYILSFRYNNKFNKYSNKNKIFYMLVPSHGNLGDQAIAYASKKFLEDKFNDYEIIEINYEDTYKYSKAIKNVMSKDDRIFLHGGGNMGNHYIHEEEARRHIIHKFKDYKINSFTQTIYFSDDENGQIEFEKTKKVYNSHPDLTLIAREDKSYEVMKINFTNNNIIKCPDIVFYLNNKLQNKKLKRDRIMTCLRKDKETYIKLDEKKQFLDKLKENYDNVFISDTVINEVVYKEYRDEKLTKIWDDFYQSEVVITDRLHGMIFCVITKTPCIVLRSLDHKVLESYKWIKDLNYIKLVDELDYEKIKVLIDELKKININNTVKFDEQYFDILREQLEV